MKNYIFFSLLAGLFVVCGMSSCSNSSNTLHAQTKSPSKGLITCPICRGTGVHEIIPGDVFAREACPCCKGKKVCTREQAAKHLKMQQEANKLINGGNSPTPTAQRQPARPVDEIQRDLKKARRHLEDLERQYRECTSYTIAAQYPDLIAKQKERIYRLEEELRRASR